MTVDKNNKFSINTVLGWLKSNIWTILFFFSQTILLFVIIRNSYSTADDMPLRIRTNCLYFIVNMSVFLMFGVVRKIFIIFYQIISIIPNLIILGWYSMNGSIMKCTDFWVVFNTNYNEACAFFSIVPAKTIIVVVSFVLFSIFLCVMACRTVNKTPKPYSKGRVFSCTLGILFWLVLSLSNPFRAHVPCVDFYNSFRNYIKETIEVSEFYENRKKINVGSSCYFSCNNRTFIIIIGESATRCHYSLYGYERPTNPHLDSLKDDLLCFDDVISPNTQTLPCIKQMLTFSNYETPDMYKKEANIVEILHDAGYKTFWLDNQGDGGIDSFTPTSYRIIAKMCDYYYVNDTYLQDETLLPLLETCLNDTASSKVVFMHLNGSHFPYNLRYPDSFDFFSSKCTASPFQDKLSDEDIAVINSYDNSILYNDFIISECIDRLKKQEGLASLIYVSDHGEEVFDTQNYYGRSFDNLSRGMCEIPCVFWRNELYKNTVVIDTNIHKSYCTDDIIHTFMDMTGTSYKQKDTTRSIFSTQFKAKERIVNTINYKSIISGK